MATSTTSVTVPASLGGTKSWNIGTGYAFVVGQHIRGVRTSDPLATYIGGLVSAYSAGNISVTVDEYSGSGVFTDWTLFINGSPGTASTFDSLSDVIITSPATGSFPRYDGANWVDALLVAGDVPNIAESQVTGLVSDLAGKASTSHTHAESDITNLVTDLAAKQTTANLSSSVSSDTGSSTKYPSIAALETYVATMVTGLLEFKGSTDCSGNPNYPSSSLKGDAYVVTVAGKIGGASGKSVDIGDMYVASSDNGGGTEASVGTSWFVLEHNLVGAVTSVTASSPLASSGGTTPDISLSSAVPLAKGGTAADLSATGGAVNTTGKQVLVQGADHAIAPRALIAADLPNTAVTPASYTNTNLTVDAQGRITAASNGSGGSGGDALAAQLIAEVSVTGAVTLTGTAFGAWHALSGTSADYTVGLPAVSGNAGKFIGFRAIDALTKIVTLDGNASELIQGALTRTMRAGDCWILLCDGTSWYVVGGDRAFSGCRAYNSGTQSINSSTWTSITLDSERFDTDGYHSTSSNTSRLTVPVAGYYYLSANICFAVGSTGVRGCRILLNGGTDVIAFNNVLTNGASFNTPISAACLWLMAAGDYVEMQGYQSQGTAINSNNDSKDAPEFSIHRVY